MMILIVDEIEINSDANERISEEIEPIIVGPVESGMMEGKRSEMKIFSENFSISEIEEINFEDNIPVLHRRFDIIEIQLDMIWVHHKINAFAVIGNKKISFSSD